MSDKLFNVNWTMNKGKSQFSAGWDPDTENRKYEEIPNGYKLTVSGTHNNHPYLWQYTAKYDGKDHRVTGRADVDSIQAFRVNNDITLGFFKKVGVFGGSYARIVSSDGRTLTVLAAGKREDGTVYFDVIEYKNAGA
jgi:hypothetical protein